MEHNLSQAWLQQDVGEGLEKLMRIVCDKIRVLEERKLQLQCNVLLSGGILALWLFKKYNINGNNLMGHTIRSVWQGISEEARFQLYSESLRQKEKVQKQEREDLEQRKLDYVCQESCCGKIFKSRDSFWKHKNKKHPWQLQLQPVPSVTVQPVPPVPVQPVSLVPVQPVSLVPVQPVPLVPVQPVPLVPPLATSKSGSVPFATGKLCLGIYKRPVPKDNSDSVIAPKSSKVCKQPPLQPNPDIRFRGFPSDAHYRANVAYRQKTGRDRPNGRNLTLLCGCSDMRPAVLNVVTHNADHILNRGADYFWCSRKAIKKIGQSVDDLTPIQKLKYNKCCNFFVFLNKPNE
ncbi:Uncharacterized protein APZ42_024601, partial [Daphnia magna]